MGWSPRPWVRSLGGIGVGCPRLRARPPGRAEAVPCEGRAVLSHGASWGWAARPFTARLCPWGGCFLGGGEQASAQAPIPWFCSGSVLEFVHDGTPLLSLATGCGSVLFAHASAGHRARRSCPVRRVREQASVLDVRQGQTTSARALSDLPLLLATALEALPPVLGVASLS